MGQAYYDEESGAIFQQFFSEEKEKDIKTQMDEFKEEFKAYHETAELIGEVQGDSKEDVKKQLDKIINEFLRKKV